MGEKIDDCDFLGISLSPLTSQRFPVLISSKWENSPTLNEIFVKFNLGENKILGKLSEPETSNPFLDKEKGQALFDYIKRFGRILGLEGPDFKIAECDIIGMAGDGKIDPLQNSPSSQTSIKPANEMDLRSFFRGTEDSVKIAKVRMSDFRIPIDPKKLFDHLDVVAPTGGGKTYLMALATIALCGREMRVWNRRGEEEHRKIKTWFLDVTGQIAEDDYGIFRRLRHDPRRVITLTDIQIETPDELVAAIEKAFNFHRMPFRKKQGDVSYWLKEAYLIDSSSWNFSGFKDALGKAIWEAYAEPRRATDHTEKTMDLLRITGGERKWKEKIEPRLKAPFKIEDLQLEAEDGKMIVVDLKDADDVEKPIFAHVLLEKLFRKANNLYKNTRTEYGFATIVFIDEAQDYCPQASPEWFQKDCHAKIIDIAKKGRKLGLGLVLMTQRYADVAKSALTQMNSHFIGKVSYGDRDRVKEFAWIEPDKINSLRRHEFWFSGLACPIEKTIVKGVKPEDVPSIQR